MNPSATLRPDSTAGGALVAGEPVVIVTAAGVVLAGFETRSEAEAALLRFREYDPPGADGCRIARARVAPSRAPARPGYR